MTATLAGKSVAILAANGFDEHQMTEIQRALIKAGATTKTIAPETGVMNGWQGNGWGHYFPVDLAIGEALGSDFDMLVVPGGERAITKLKPNLHARRIINHFFEANKPIAAIEAGVALLALSPRITDREVVAAEIAAADIRQAGAEVMPETTLHNEGNLLTADGSDITAWVEAALTLFATPEEQGEDVSQAA